MQMVVVKGFLFVVWFYDLDVVVERFTGPMVGRVHGMVWCTPKLVGLDSRKEQSIMTNTWVCLK